MEPLAAAFTLASILVVVVLSGVLLTKRPTRSRSTRRDPLVGLGDIGLGQFGAHATLVQFSTELCSRCPGVKRVVSELASARPGIVVAHVDLTRQPELARKFGVLQTPTVLVLDHAGSTHARLAGRVTRADLAHELTTLSGASRVS